MWILWRAKSGRRWLWWALIRLEVGAPMRFVSGDIQYVKRRKCDQIHVSLRFFLVSAEAHGFVRELGNFCRLQPVGGHGSNTGSRSIWTFRRTKSGRRWIWEVLIRFRCGYFGELNLGEIGSGRRWYPLMWVFRRTTAGRHWIWQALRRLDVGI